MRLDQDLNRILKTICHDDPSFKGVQAGKIDSRLEEIRQHVERNDVEGFLLSTMALLSLPANGHTRLIPNRSISVLPLRFVAIGTVFRLTAAPPQYREYLGGRLVTVNGVGIDALEDAARPYLAGTRQRQRAIGGIIFVWPNALIRLGAGPKNDGFEYELEVETGENVRIRVDEDASVPAACLYPQNEHGRPGASQNINAIAETEDWPGNGFSIRLPSFFDPDGDTLPKSIRRVVDQVSARQGCTLLIDVRGNTGGDFLETMPLITEIATNWQGGRCAMLVDKFTFSAAIVFVAILKHRLGNRLTLIGEEMGDGLRFFAEGGLIDLPQCGALVRYSTALHDWENGVADRTTPRDIAEQLVPVGQLKIDLHHVASCDEMRSQRGFYLKIFDGLRE